MSCRQPAPKSATLMATAEDTEGKNGLILSVLGGEGVLVRNRRYLAGRKRLEECARRVELELRIVRLDAEKEPVAAGERESGHVEDRVIRHRKAVQCKHPQHRRQR